jgi:hypothetical protein
VKIAGTVSVRAEAVHGEISPGFARIAGQVFDTDGNFKKESRIGGLAWSLCVTPGPNQVIFVGSIRRVYKYYLSGKLLGEFGKLGRLVGWFESIHAVACPDEKTLFLAEEFSYRFDKVVLQ